LKILKDAGIMRFINDGTKRMYSIVHVRIYTVVVASTPELQNGSEKKYLIASYTNKNKK
jgi:hypothetical protein